MKLHITEPVAVRENLLKKATLELIPGSCVGVMQTEEKGMTVPRQREKHMKWPEGKMIRFGNYKKFHEVKYTGSMVREEVRGWQGSACEPS